MATSSTIILKKVDNTLSVGDMVIVTFGKLRNKIGVIKYIKTSLWTGDEVCEIVHPETGETNIVYLNEVNRV